MSEKLSKMLMEWAEENELHEPGPGPCHCDICQRFVPMAIVLEQAAAPKPPITPPHLYPMCTCYLQQPYRGPEHSMHCLLHKRASELPPLEEISHVHSIPKMDDGK